MYVVHLEAIVSVFVLVRFFHVASHATATWKVVCSSVIIPSLQWDAPRIKTFILIGHNLLVAFLSDDDSGVTPCEVVLVPKRVDGKDKGVYGESQKIDDHPPDVLPLSLQDEYDSLETVHSSDQNERYQRKLA